MSFIARLRPTPALVVAIIALLAALAGTSVAAVTTLIAPNSVASAQVVDGSLLRQDFKAGQIPAGQRGARGPAGPQGPAGTNANSIATGATVKAFTFSDVAGFQQVVSKNLPAGSWAIVATINTTVDTGRTKDSSELACELRNGSVTIGGATDRVDSSTLNPLGRYTTKRSVSMNGGAQVPEGGGEVSVPCKPELKGESVDSAQMMMIKVGSFS